MSSSSTKKLNSKKTVTASGHVVATSQSNDEDELTRLALEELTRGAKRAKERSQTLGSLGWKNSPVPSANKRYLQNTLVATLQNNKRIEKNAQKAEVQTSSSSSSSRKRSSRKRSSSGDKKERKARDEKRTNGKRKKH